MRKQFVMCRVAKCAYNLQYLTGTVRGAVEGRPLLLKLKSVSCRAAFSRFTVRVVTGHRSRRTLRCWYINFNVRCGIICYRSAAIITQVYTGWYRVDTVYNIDESRQWVNGSNGSLFRICHMVHEYVHPRPMYAIRAHYI